MKSFESSVEIEGNKTIQNTESIDESMEFEAAVNKASRSILAENIDESKESESSSLKQTQQVTDQVSTISHELHSNSTLEQAHSDIKNMLKSKVDLNDKEEYATLLLWDFAGDEEFYHTHQTFLSPDSIYLVVTKLNEADDKKAKGNKTTNYLMKSP